MRIGFDLDGTLADLQAGLAREAASLFPDLDPASLPQSIPSAATPEDDGREAPPIDTPVAARTLTSRQQRELWSVVCSRDNFWETLDEIESGALARLSRVARERKWEVIFLTSRPQTKGDTAQRQSHRWLASHGFELPSIFVVHGSRGKIAAALALDVVVDDRPENGVDVALDSTARAILIWRGEEGSVLDSARALGIGVVASIGACIDILEELERPDRQQQGMVGRLKRLLGLKPRPRARDDGRTESETAGGAAQSG